MFRIFVIRKDDPVVKRREEAGGEKTEGPLQGWLSNIRFWVWLWLASFHSVPLVGNIHSSPREIDDQKRKESGEDTCVGYIVCGGSNRNAPFPRHHLDLGQ